MFICPFRLLLKKNFSKVIHNYRKVLCKSSQVCNQTEEAQIFVKNFDIFMLFRATILELSIMSKNITLSFKNPHFSLFNIRLFSRICLQSPPELPVVIQPTKSSEIFGTPLYCRKHFPPVSFENTLSHLLFLKTKDCVYRTQTEWLGCNFSWVFYLTILWFEI